MSEAAQSFSPEEGDALTPPEHRTPGAWALEDTSLSSEEIGDRLEEFVSSKGLRAFHDRDQRERYMLDGTLTALEAISLSTGIEEGTEPDTEILALIEQAEQALEKARKNGTIMDLLDKLFEVMEENKSSNVLRAVDQLDGKYNRLYEGEVVHLRKLTLMILFLHQSE